MSLIHGETRGGKCSPEYSSFHAMLKRCNNPKDYFYDDYGGRGIRVCNEWNGSSKFQAFLAHMGRKPSAKHTLDRWPNRDGNYEPGNVRWATMAEQMRNTRRTRFFTINGVTLCLTDWCVKYGISRDCAKLRLKRGWPIEDALSVPKLDGVSYRLRHLTEEQRNERQLQHIRDWHAAHPDKMRHYAEERIKRNKAKSHDWSKPTQLDIPKI